MFVISYFTTEDESLFLACGGDGHTFRPLFGGKPVLRGEVGTRGLRDPFLGIGPDGAFHLLATDGWRSTSIVHATSSNLVEWSPQRLIPVMGNIPGAHNAWAPEFFIDPRTGLIHLIWSSIVDSDAVVGDLTTQTHEHRIWSTTTTDFVSFTPARLFFDPGFSVIDATVHRLANGFLMAFKDERGVNDLATKNKNIGITSFEHPFAGFAPPVLAVTPSPVEAPTLFRRGDEYVLLFDRFLESHYGAMSSTDLKTWKETDITLPAGMRHASVLHIPDETFPSLAEVCDA